MGDGPGIFEQAGKAPSAGLVSELWGFLKVNKKWWLLPIFVVMLLAIGLVILASTGAAPFVYTIF